MKHLFFDDHIIERTDFDRVWHKPDISDNPVILPDQPYETDGGYCPVAAPFCDGALYDKSAGLFRIWYFAGWFGNTAYAESTDGVNWRKRGLVRGIRGTGSFCYRDGCTVIENPFSGPKFIMYIFYRKYNRAVPAHLLHNEKADGIIREIYGSDNGMDWEFINDAGPGGDNSSFFYNNIDNEWGFSLRTVNEIGERTRGYFGVKDLLGNPLWNSGDIKVWADIDLGPPDPELGYKPQLYKVDCAPYEDLLLGLFAVFYGPPNHECDRLKRPKIINLLLGFSRNGRDWTMSPEPFISSSKIPGSWNFGYMHASGGCYAEKDNLLRFYFGAFSGISPKLGAHMYAGGSTGLAVIGKDRFVSFDSIGGRRTLRTRPLEISGGSVLINADARDGLLAEFYKGDRKVSGQLLKGDSSGHLAMVPEDGEFNIRFTSSGCSIYSVYTQANSKL